MVSASAPGEQGVGCNYLRDLCGLLPFDEVVFHSAGLLQSTPESAGLEIRTPPNALLLRYESAWRYGPPVVRDVGTLMAFLIKTKPWARKAAREFGQSAEFISAEHVCFVLESPQLILMADALRNSSGKRLVILVWDHVDQVLSNFGHAGAAAAAIRAAFTRVVGAASATISVSETLSEWLGSMNPSASHTVVPAPVLSGMPVSHVRHSLDQFVIGFAGSVTAPNELEGLMRALDSMGWRIGNSNVILRLFGPRFVLTARTRRNIQYAGFLPTTDEALQQLSECDVCFLPQPFGVKDELLARFSFPTKLTAYLTAGRPILIHAPSWASIPSTFPRESPGLSGGICDVGMVCTEPDCATLIPLLKQLAEDPNIFRQCVERIDQTRRSRFSPQHLKAELNRAFGIS